MRLLKFGTIAAVALLAAAVIAAFVWLAAFRAGDHVQLVVTELPRLSPMPGDATQPRLAVSAAHIMTFVNAGRRPAAIVSARLIVVDGPPEANCENYAGITLGATAYDYDLEPLVLAPRQIAVRRVELKPSADKTAPAFEPMFGNEKRERLRIISCAAFHVVVPGYSVDAHVQVGDFTVSPDGSGVETQFPPTDVRTLLRRRGVLRRR